MTAKQNAERILSDVACSFWLREALDHLDKLDGRDPVDAMADMRMLANHLDILRTENRRNLQKKSFAYLTGTRVNLT